MAIAGMLGKLDPYPEDTHPRVKLADHLIPASLPVVPPVVDYASRVKVWPVYLNNQIGDCTCAGLGHAVQAWTAYTKGLVTLPDSAILNVYEAMGYDPRYPATDQGAVEHDVLAWAQQHGIGGHKILAFAQVNHRDPEEMKLALHLFGSVYMGAKMPQSSLLQTGAGQPWTVQTGSPVAGGHCFVLQRWDTSTFPMEVVTWGQMQDMSVEFWLDYGDEAWAVISEDWFNYNGQSFTGLELPELGDDFALVTGQPNPFRLPPKQKCCIGMFDRAMTRWFDITGHAR